MSTFKKILSIVVRILLWIIILVAALFAFTTLATRSNDHVANIAGYTPMTVLSDSMSPTFNRGDLIIIRTTDPATLAVGDVVTFHTIIENEYALNTHRIKEVNVSEGGIRSYITQGDNNLVQDQRTVYVGDIVGKYVGRVPYLGFVMNFLSSSIGFLIVIVLPLLVFFIYQVYHLVMVSIKLKKAVAAEAAIEAAEAAAAGNDEKALAAEQARKEAEAALEEARRLKAEAEAALAQAKAAASGAPEGAADAADQAAEDLKATVNEAADAAQEAADAADETVKAAADEASDAINHIAEAAADEGITEKTEE